MKSDKFLAVLRANNKKRAHLPDTPEIMQQIRDLHAQGYTKRDIGDILGVGWTVIQKRFKLLGLRGRDGKPNLLRPRQYKEENTAFFRATQLEPFIREYYVEKGLSSVAVGAMCGLQYQAILSYARLLGFPILTRSQAAAKRHGTLNLTGPLLEILEGELLGDGCLLKPRTPSTHFVYTTSRGSYISWLAYLLRSYGMMGKCYGPRMNKNSFGKTCFDYHSWRYPELVDLYQRWYPQGKKTVPRDMVLTPTVCRHWYIGDGSFSRRKLHHAPYIVIATMGFSYEDVEYLCGLLSVHIPNVRVRTHPNGPTLFLGKEGTAAFLAYIGPCPEGIRGDYGYKWGLPKIALGQLSLGF